MINSDMNNDDDMAANIIDDKTQSTHHASLFLAMTILMRLTTEGGRSFGAEEEECSPEGFESAIAATVPV